jgi:uncharacterized tellurite resistance protein B-like protein
MAATMIDPADIRLRDVVKLTLKGADSDKIAIVTACAGLLACVAYADREFSPAEAAKAGALMATVQGIGPEGSRAIVQALQANVLELTTVHAMRFARTLRDLADHDLRLMIVSMLLELAAVDDDIKLSEVNTLRQITGALGLTQEEYNGLQEKYRERLRTVRAADSLDD